MKKFSFAIFLITFLFIEQSCQKIDTTNLGVGLIPTVDNINTFDTILNVITNNQFISDTITLGPTQNHALGVLEDPEFGTTTASIYLDVLPSTSGVSPFIKKDSIIAIDSVVLSLNFTGLYGDSTSVENLHVYEIDQQANFTDSVYAVTGPDFPVVATQLGEKLVDFTTLNDPQLIKHGEDTGLVNEQNILRIKLNKSLGERLAAYDTLTAYQSDSVFRTKFKGLAIKVDATGATRRKALAYFSLTDNTKTRLTVYYRVTNNGQIDTTLTDFVYKNQVARGANIIRRNIAGTNYAGNIATSTPNKDKLYIQSSPGSYFRVTVPSLGSLSNRLIYKAELLVERLPSTNDDLFTPPVLFLDVNDSVNNRFISIKNDFTTDLAGTYNVADFGGNIKQDQYSFNITRYLQGIITRKEPALPFRLYAPFYTWPVYIPVTANRGYPITVNPNIASGRVVVGGGSHPTKMMRIRIIYSKI